MNRPLLIFGLMIIISLPLAANAQESTLIIGGQLGQFAPSDRRLQGSGLIYTSNQSGIDGAWEAIGFIGYRRGQIEYRIESGTRRHDHKLNYWRESTHQLYVYPVAISAIYRGSLGQSKIVPFLGIGAGIYISKWQEYYYDPSEILHLIRGDAIHPGYHILAGADYAIGDFSLISELRYSQIYGDWEFTGQYGDISRISSSLNIGGISLRIGLGYEL